VKDFGLFSAIVSFTAIVSGAICSTMIIVMIGSRSAGIGAGQTNVGAAEEGVSQMSCLPQSFGHHSHSHVQ